MRRPTVPPRRCGCAWRLAAKVARIGPSEYPGKDRGRSLSGLVSQSIHEQHQQCRMGRAQQNPSWSESMGFVPINPSYVALANDSRSALARRHSVFGKIGEPTIYLKADASSVLEFKREGSGPFTYTLSCPVTRELTAIFHTLPLLPLTSPAVVFHSELSFSGD